MLLSNILAAVICTVVVVRRTGAFCDDITENTIFWSYTKIKIITLKKKTAQAIDKAYSATENIYMCKINLFAVYSRKTLIP